MEKAGYHVGDDVVFAMDAAASELYDEEKDVIISRERADRKVKKSFAIQKR